MPPSPASASRTARLVAACRARAGRFCDDPFAAALAGDDGQQLVDRFARHYPDLVAWIGVRTAYIDACIARFVGPARPQVVLLGAGLDARAARLARPGVRWFEVDTPASQADKRARTDALADYPTDAATLVACDFARDDFAERLVAGGFDPAVPAFVVWEGVTYYLSEAVVRATLARLAEALHPASVVVFDSVPRRAVEDVDAAAQFGAVGEPMRFGVNDVLPLVYAAGFRSIRTTRFDEACLNLFGEYVRERAFRFQRLTLAARTAPELP